MATVLGIVVINTIIAMATTSKIDKYWTLHPEWESSYMYHQLWRFYKYGFYVLSRRKPFIELPLKIKLWVSISFVINLGIILAFIFAKLVLMP